MCVACLRAALALALLDSCAHDAVDDRGHNATDDGHIVDRKGTRLVTAQILCKVNATRAVQWTAVLQLLDLDRGL